MLNGKAVDDSAEILADSRFDTPPTSLVVSSNSGCKMPHPHWHAQVEVNYLYSGALAYKMPGYTVQLAKGDVGMFWGGQPHQAVETTPDLQLIAIHLPLLHFFRLKMQTDLMVRLKRGGTLITADPDGGDETFFRRIARYMQGNEAEQDQGISELLLRINRVNFEDHRMVGASEGPAFNEVVDNQSHRTVVDICRYITENFREDIGSADVASFADMHPKYAMSVFRRSTGMTLNEYITLLRLSYAQALLMKQELTVLDVALESGFGSFSAFTSAFRKVTGQSPSDFRRERVGISAA